MKKRKVVSRKKTRRHRLVARHRKKVTPTGIKFSHIFAAIATILVLGLIVSSLTVFSGSAGVGTGLVVADTLTEKPTPIQEKQETPVVSTSTPKTEEVLVPSSFTILVNQVTFEGLVHFSSKLFVDRDDVLVSGSFASLQSNPRVTVTPLNIYEQDEKVGGFDLYASFDGPYSDKKTFSASSLTLSSKTFDYHSYDVPVFPQWNDRTYAAIQLFGKDELLDLAKNQPGNSTSVTNVRTTDAEVRVDDKKNFNTYYLPVKNAVIANARFELVGPQHEALLDGVNLFSGVKLVATAASDKNVCRDCLSFEKTVKGMKVRIDYSGKQASHALNEKFTVTAIAPPYVKLAEFQAFFEVVVPPLNTFFRNVKIESPFSACGKPVVLLDETRADNTSTAFSLVVEKNPAKDFSQLESASVTFGSEEQELPLGAPYLDPKKIAISHDGSIMALEPTTTGQAVFKAKTSNGVVVQDFSKKDVFIPVDLSNGRNSVLRECSSNRVVVALEEDKELDLSLEDANYSVTLKYGGQQLAVKRNSETVSCGTTVKNLRLMEGSPMPCVRRDGTLVLTATLVKTSASNTIALLDLSLPE